MRRPGCFWALVLGLYLAPMGIASAGTVHGIVTNGTTGKPAGGVEVILIQLQGGMVPVANSKTDAQGQFSFDNPSLGTQPMLLRAVFHGVFFHEPAPPGKSDVQIEVYEPTEDPKTISVPSRVVVFQPNGANLIVGEEYSIQNNSKPPLAYYRSDGNFDFSIPDNAELQQVAAWGPAGMPVVQATIDHGKNRHSISFAFRPGESGVRMSYQLPYSGDHATVKIPSEYPGARLLLVAPPTVQVTADGLQPQGQEQGMNVYVAQNISPKTPFSVDISGTAPPPSDANAGSDAGGMPGSQGGDASAGVSIQQVPGRLDALKWPLIVGFLGLFAVGAVLLARKPVAVAPSSVGNTTTPPHATVPPLAAAVTSAVPAPVAMAALDREVGTSLDALKERLFRLELRKQAGTIADEEYAQERAKAEKILRDLVRG